MVPKLVACFVVVVIIYMAGVFLAGMSPQTGMCMSDSDCVPGSCCHPDTCVHISLAPDCSNTLCTLNCQPDTMDCGYGHCECQQGECVSVITGWEI